MTQLSNAILALLITCTAIPAQHSSCLSVSPVVCLHVHLSVHVTHWTDSVPGALP